MTRGEQLLALLKSHGEGDDEQFYAVAMQIAAQEARRGHTTLARELRDLVDRAKERRAAVRVKGGPVPIIRPRGDLENLLTAGFTQERLADLIAPPALAQRLARILSEHRQRDKLAAHGLVPRHKILLIGPPGSGKTMTARVLAGELHLPLLTIRLESVITKFMGETAAKLRLIFDAMTETRGVYLFDEFDALGSHRDSRNDVGEVRRILNSFLQFLDEDRSHSLIVAATNFPALLDKALYRRFDDVLEYSLPTSEMIVTVLRSRLAAFDTRAVDWPRVAEIAQGLSQADIVRAAEDAAKSAILDDAAGMDTERLMRAVSERRRTDTVEDPRR